MNTPKINDKILLEIEGVPTEVTVYRTLERNKNNDGSSNGMMLTSHGRLAWISKEGATLIKQLMQDDYWSEFEEFFQNNK